MKSAKEKWSLNSVGKSLDFGKGKFEKTEIKPQPLFEEDKTISKKEEAGRHATKPQVFDKERSIKKVASTSTSYSTPYSSSNNSSPLLPELLKKNGLSLEETKSKKLEFKAINK